jgi:eukaryotic-like serine/threonine-protein kinase
VELRPGQIIGSDYRIVQPLAAGGMGAVYVAEQLSTGKRRALKVMHRELASDAESQRRFMQEARVGSLIASEHIVEVQNAGIDQGTGHPFLVMELLEGEDLQARIARGPVSLDETRSILGQLCHALGAAHDANVVHRDLKPQNIFLSVRRSAGDTLHVKVLDFGIAKVVESHKATAATGTPMWLAPEQTERGHITCAADVWALGLLVFTMLTGGIFWKTPSRSGGSLIDLLGEILRAPIPAASARAAELGRPLPPGFDAWFLRCVSRPPSSRFANAREAYAALAPVLGAAAVPPPFVQPVFVQPPFVSPPAQSKSRAGLVVGLGIGFLILLGAIAAIAAVALDKIAVTAPAAASQPPTTASPPAAVTSAAPPPQPDNGSGVVHLMVMSDLPELQSALVSDATLTAKVEACVAPVRTVKRASLVLVFEVSSAGLNHVMTQGQPLGPHVQCVVNAISKRSLPPMPAKKKATLQVFVTWS